MSQGYEIEEGVTLRLPPLTGKQLLAEASADDLRVLFALAEEDYRTSVDALARKTGMTLTRTAAAVEHWLDAGVLKEKTTPEKSPYLPSDDLPLGRAGDDARVIGEKNLQGYLDTCALILKKQLNPAEVNILVALINDLGASEYYITTLLSHCVGTLHCHGIRYLEKTATSLFDRGIRSDAALDEYIRASELAHSNEGAIRRLYGMGARELTDGERECLIRWFSTYGYDLDIIGLAYDRTVATANKVTVKYTDKILAEWHRLGIKTVSAAEEYIQKKADEAAAKQTRTKKPTAPAKAPASFDIDRFFESALKRSYGSTDQQTTDSDQKGD